jgi:hypothetical protein
VRGPAVHLDDEVSIAPQEVDGVWADAPVRGRKGEAVASAQAEEIGFGLAAGAVGVQPSQVQILVVGFADGAAV